MKTMWGRITEGIFQPWGGRCQCLRCMNKSRTPGFYRASMDEYTMAEKTNDELRERYDYQMEMLPPVIVEPERESIIDYARRIKTMQRQQEIFDTFKMPEGEAA